LIKIEGNQYGQGVSYFEGPIALLPCASHNFYEKCTDCTDEATCAVNKLMTEVRDNTLKILENNTLILILLS
jgi:DNA-binding IscR family transcriptional regulator